MPKHPIYLTILLLLLTALALLPLVKVPVSFSSRGVVRSMQENVKLTALVGGKVVTNKLQSNNQPIQQGDTLLTLTTELLGTQKQLQQTQQQDYIAQLQDLQSLTQGQYQNLQTGLYQREASALQERVAQLQAQLSLSAKELERATILLNQKAIAQAEYDKIYYPHQSLKSQIANIQTQQTAQWQAQQRDVERQLRALGADIRRISQEEKNYYITAPISGTLVNFSGLQQDAFLLQGQNIGEISPDSSLIVECMVFPKDIGFIKKDQKVRFQIDTYNYNQWGLSEGKVTDIDQNITVLQNGQAFFKVRCAMDNNYLQLKNGYKGQISKGMTLTARFHLTERTLWQLLFDKVDDWLNPKLVSNEQLVISNEQ